MYVSSDEDVVSEAFRHCPRPNPTHKKSVRALSPQFRGTALSRQSVVGGLPGRFPLGSPAKSYARTLQESFARRPVAETVHELFEGIEHEELVL